MSAPTVAEHLCNPDPFAVCECGRPGHRTFGPNVRPKTVAVIEAVFEFVEALPSGETFTIPQLTNQIRNYSTAPKALYLMEHFCYVERADVGGRPILWRRVDIASKGQPASARHLAGAAS